MTCTEATRAPGTIGNALPVRGVHARTRGAGRILWACVLLAGAAVPLPADATVDVRLDGVEFRIVEHVDGEQARALALLEKTVNINSGTMNFAGVRRVGDVLAREFRELGFEVEWIDGADFDRAGHLVARHDAGVGPALLLIGHLDTVFAADSAFQRFEMLPDNRARGPGITDMKGGNVIIVQALRALRAAGGLERMRVRVVLTGDEEDRGEPFERANAAIIEGARWADYAIGFEDGDGDPRTVVVSRRGSTNWTLEVSGTPAHSSQVFREDIGYGAIYEAARILDGFRTALSETANLTFNPGVIVGGTEAALDSTSAGTAFGKRNVIARTALVNGDIRALSPAQLADAKVRMQAIVDGHLPGTDARLEFSDKYPPMAPSPGNLQLLELYNRVSLDLGAGPVTAVDPRQAGAADIAFAAEHVRMAIDGVGLMGEGGHTEDETADLDTLPLQTRRAAILLYRLAVSPP